MNAPRRVSKPICAAALSVGLAACTSVTSESGRNFDAAHVQEIRKSATTATEVGQWFGPPLSKEPTSAREEKWTYYWGRATASGSVLLGNMDATGVRKKLILLLKDGVVQNYTYEEGPVEQHTRGGAR